MNKDLLWGLVFGALFIAIAQAVFYYIEGPVPYTDAYIKSIEETEEGYLIEAHFHKNECVFVNLETFGVNTGVPHLLEWVPADGPANGEYDLPAGDQQINILVKDGGRDYKTIKLRTRHDCGGVFVDQIFATIDT